MSRETMRALLPLHLFINQYLLCNLPLSPQGQETNVHPDTALHKAVRPLIYCCLMFVVLKLCFAIGQIDVLEFQRPHKYRYHSYTGYQNVGLLCGMDLKTGNCGEMICVRETKRVR